MIDTQLESALSIQDAVLPNETLAHDENLIKNGKADCNTSLISDWTLSNVNVTVIMSSTSKSNCQFTLQSLSSGAAMKQRVNLYGKWDSNSWPYSQAVLRTSMSIGITMELRGINSNNLVVARQSLNSTAASTSLLLNEKMRELEVFIDFTAIDSYSNVTNNRFEDVKLFIIYGTYLELLRGE
ncbi:unnamed protein product [Rotaria magnacalcarata]|nr:unnamed protein product [Rotaria magnacalcarata]